MQHNRFNQADKQAKADKAKTEREAKDKEWRIDRRIQACDNPQGAFQQYQQQFTQQQPHLMQQPSGMFNQNPVINNQPPMQCPSLNGILPYQDNSTVKYSNTKHQPLAHHHLDARGVQNFIESKGFKVASKYNLDKVELKTIFIEEDGSTAELAITFDYLANKWFTPEGVKVEYLSSKDNSDKNEVFGTINGYANRVIQHVVTLLDGKTPTLSVDYIQLGITNNFFVREVIIKDTTKYLYLDTVIDGNYKSYELVIFIKGTNVEFVVNDERNGIVVLNCSVDYGKRNIAEVISTLESLVRSLAY